MKVDIFNSGHHIIRVFAIPPSVMAFPFPLVSELGESGIDYSKYYNRRSIFICKTHKLRDSQSRQASIDCDRAIDSLIDRTVN